jgi:hypothetical protein
MRRKALESLDVKAEDDMPVTIRGAGGQTFVARKSCELKLKLDDYEFDSKIVVVEDSQISYDLIVGEDVLVQAKILIDRNGVQIVGRDEIAEVMSIQVVPEVELHHIKDDQVRNKVADLISNFSPSESPKSTEVEMKIVLRDEEPVFQSPTRMSPKENEIVEKIVMEWQKAGIIRPSCSEYSSPAVLVDKKDGSKRLCVNYKKLNEKTVRDRYPLPVMEDLIARLKDSRIFSTLDLENGFFHVKVNEMSKKYTSFVVPFGQYEFNRVPFGLTNSPSVFMRFVHRVFRPLMLEGILLIYLDDLMVLAVDEDEAANRLERVLGVAEDYGLNIKWKKCNFVKNEVEFLGLVVKDGTITPSPDRVKAVMHFPTPKSIKKLQSFLGLTSYFRKFIENYSLIAKPLSDLFRGDAKFSWHGKQQEAFQKLKECLSNHPVLQIYDPSAETELHTDACASSYGSVLMQRNKEDKKFHPVYFFNRKTSQDQEKWCSYDLEALAVVKSLEKFRVYLLGIPFKIVTDCQAFAMAMRSKNVSRKAARWAEELETFDYTIEHRPGSKMKHVDALSRNVMVIEVENELVSKVKNLQKNDETLKPIRLILAEEKPYEKYLLRGGILFREDDSGEELLVVPRSLQMEVLRKVHEMGHFGPQKMSEVVTRQFYIPGLKDKIQRVIQSCVECLLSNRKTGKMEGYLHPINKGDAPLETYHIDHLTPAAGTSKGYQHIFAVVDAFSKFVWLYPTKTLNTNEVLKSLEWQSEIFGNPRRIISDKGSAFTSTDFADYCRVEKINHVTVTTGVPRGNGQVERINRIVINVLTKLTPDDHPEHWYKHLRKVQKFINATLSRSTGYSPFEILFGTKMRCAEDAEILKAIQDEIESNFLEERSELRENASRNIHDITQENISTYNRRRKEAKDYKVGDVVAIKKTQYGGSKISKNFLGPYVIKEVKSNERFEVEKVGDHPGPSVTSTSADNMKPYVDEETFSEDESEETVEEQFLDSTEDQEDFHGFTEEDLRSGRPQHEDGRDVGGRT